jgi:hypothetical protein
MKLEIVNGPLSIAIGHLWNRSRRTSRSESDTPTDLLELVDAEPATAQQLQDVREQVLEALNEATDVRTDRHPPPLHGLRPGRVGAYAVVELHLFVASDGLPAGYRFPCPACGAEPIEPATPRFAGVLTLADVVVTVGDRAPWQSPAPDRRD